MVCFWGCVWGGRVVSGGRVWTGAVISGGTSPASPGRNTSASAPTATTARITGSQNFFRFIVSLFPFYTLCTL